MNTIQLNVKLTEAQRRVVFALAKAAGVKVHVDGKEYCEITDIDELIAEYESWKYFQLTSDGISAHRVVSSQDVSHADFLLAIADFKRELEFDIRINENIIAKVNVTKGEVVVGCQTFKLETIEELVKRANKVRDDVTV